MWNRRKPAAQPLSGLGEDGKSPADAGGYEKGSDQPKIAAWPDAPLLIFFRRSVADHLPSVFGIMFSTVNNAIKIFLAAQLTDDVFANGAECRHSLSHCIDGYAGAHI